MTTMKRILRIEWLALVIVLTTLRLSAGVYTVRVPNYQANPGTVLRVPLTLDNVAGLALIRLQLNYDPQILTLLQVSAGPLGAQFDFSHEAVGGSVTMDFVRTTPMGSGSGRLAVAEFLLNPGAATNSYSDLAIARFDLGDSTGVRDVAVGQTIRTENGSVRVSLSSQIDNESNGLPDWWELQHNLDLFSPEGTGDTDGNQRDRPFRAVEHHASVLCVRRDQFGCRKIGHDALDAERQKLVALRLDETAVPVRQPLRRDRGKRGEDRQQ
jgi:hypothetical protein